MITEIFLHKRTLDQFIPVLHWSFKSKRISPYSAWKMRLWLAMIIGSAGEKWLWWWRTLESSLTIRKIRRLFGWSAFDYFPISLYWELSTTFVNSNPLELRLHWSNMIYCKPIVSVLNNKLIREWILRFIQNLFFTYSKELQPISSLPQDCCL